MDAQRESWFALHALQAHDASESRRTSGHAEKF
jgi:hypothetical protein